MATFLIALFSVILVLTCLFVTLLVLMQKPSANSGMGAALGGGAAEQAFGGEAGNVLTKGTIYAIIAFFILSFGLYLGTLATVEREQAGTGGASIRNLEAGAVGEATLPDEAMEPTPGGAESPGAAAGAAEETESNGQAEAPAVDQDTSPAEPTPLQLEKLDLDSTQPAGGS